MGALGGGLLQLLPTDDALLQLAHQNRHRPLLLLLFAHTQLLTSATTDGRRMLVFLLVIIILSASLWED